MKHITGLLIALGLFVGLTGASNAAWAESRSAEVRLIATINNNPAFKPVQWKVYRVDGRGSTRHSNRHTFTLHDLEPGRYTAVAWLEDASPPRKRKRDFFVMADTTNSVHIPLD
ncbi:MAG: hypothetical protein CR991_06045 [Proteobacteria bacterium]|nr:MAG: hypothetical protein CR991_06045 [Pseudomonadota bacterium]